MKPCDKACCACGSKEVRPGILVLNRRAVLSAFPKLKPRKRFPLCRECNRKLKWVKVSDE